MVNYKCEINFELDDYRGDSFYFFGPGVFPFFRYYFSYVATLECQFIHIN